MCECGFNYLMELKDNVTHGFCTVNKLFKQQNKFNRNTIIASLAMLGCVVILNKKIEKLSDELEELKQTRGE